MPRFKKYLRGTLKKVFSKRPMNVTLCFFFSLINANRIIRGTLKIKIARIVAQCKISFYRPMK